MKGIGLLAIEGASVYAGYVNGKSLQNDFNTIQNSTKNNNGGGGSSIPTDISPEEARVGVCLVAGAAFIFSWWDDIAGSGIAADEYNKLARQNGISMGVTPVPGGAILAFDARY